jgi:hypothetical protein
VTLRRAQPDAGVVRQIHKRLKNNKLRPASKMKKWIKEENKPKVIN